MKKLLFLTIWATSVSAFALPTYEPFSEFAPTLASSPTNLVVRDSNNNSIGTNANASLLNCLDLATGGYTAPGGELWGNLNFAGTGTSILRGLDVAVVSNTSIFTAANLAALLPSTFPGMPTAGQAITNLAENASQPWLWNGSNAFALSNYVGNSAVLKFAQDVTRPTSGIKTVFVSYLLDVAQQGQLGGGNNGRYLGFLASSNLVEGTGSGGAYTTWSPLFNTFNGTSAGGVHYPSHGLLSKTAAASYYIGACDSSAGRNWTSTSLFANYGAPVFVVGAYVLNSGTNQDTNVLWMNPATSTFGGAAPPVTSVHAWPMAFNMTDLGGMVLIDRVGNGGAGGVGTNYIANLLVGTTWSYVTGGPEFTNAPAANTYITAYGQNVSMSGNAVAANQTISSYQWQKVTAGVTNNLTDGSGTAGGSAVVAGSGTTNLTLTGVTAGDLGTFQLLATASGTGYQLAAPTVLSLYIDPHINSVPGNVSTNYGGTATFSVQIGTLNAPLSYGWYHGATPLVNGSQTGGSVATGATGTTGAGTNFTLTLTLTNVSYLDAGNYTLYVTNAASQVNNSAAASLTVVDPIVATQPRAYTVLAPGATTNISVVARGSATVTYQWYGQNQGQLSDGGNFLGTATSTLTITNAQYANSDNYYVILGGPGGATPQSSNAVVYINNPALGPFPTNSLPPTIASNAIVDYHIVDSTLASTLQIPASWNNNMSLASGSDQAYSQISLGGLTCDQATATYFNFADPNWKQFVNVPQIDVLLLVYGNSALYNNTNGPLPTTFSYGSVGGNTVYYNHSGTIPLGANNGQWNWMLLTTTNVVDANGYRTVGDPVAGVGLTYGGINNGTIRLEDTAMSGFTIAAYALGPHGAFGASNQINRFAAPTSCADEPTNNLAYVDFNLGITNHLLVVNDAGLGETYAIQAGVGPTNDLRTAIQSTSGQMEFPILGNYLGLPCNQAHTMQLCMEVYDDPALTGTQLGPYQYATDSQGDLQTYLGQFYTLTGSGQWIKVAFYFGPANLQGVNTAPLTGGPTVLFSGGNPFIDRVELGVLRTGTNVHAGQIPDPNYLLAPLVTCSNGVGYYAEWYPSHGITNNLDVANGYSTVSGIGPVNDQRIAEVPQSAPAGFYYEMFTLQNNVFGPVYQDNSDVILSLDYYDDPALSNITIYPNAYNTLNNGNNGVISPSAPYGTPVTLTGSGKWKTATWELPNVNFSGGYVCRFASTAPVYVSRARYNVIRPCGTYEGIDYLQQLSLSASNSQINLTWRGQASVQTAPAVTGTYSNILSITNTTTNVYTVGPSVMTNKAQFYRLSLPGYPTNLSPYGP